jgi:hypothetical protein
MTGEPFEFPNDMESLGQQNTNQILIDTLLNYNNHDEIS